MKPQHGESKRLSRCPCCQTKYGKHKSGNHRARQKIKQQLKKEI